MKKILMRAGVMPYEEITPEDCLNRNIIGGNSGNLFYQYSMVKALYTEGTEVVANRYKVNLNDVDRINEEYSAFVIPLADAFRKNFMKELNELTELVKRLTIPCVVTGVGLRAPYEPDFSISYSFDEDVKRFVNAVLEKSPMLGLRGEITGEYLKKLGYKEEKDFTVIGCPSLYANGAELKMRELNLNEDSAISISTILYANPTLDRFVKRIGEMYPNHYFVGQLRQELRLLYTGFGFDGSPLYPCKNVDSRDYQNGRARFFINVPSWIEHMKKMDLSVGGRFHGNVAGILAGTPSILIANDARKREFMRFHKIPGIAEKDITEELTLSDIVSKIDFYKAYKNHKENFEHFVRFLNTCGLDNIYNKQQEKDCFQERMDTVVFDSGVKPLLHHNDETFEKRVQNSYQWLQETYATLSQENQVLSQWLDIKGEGKSFAEFFQKKGYSKIALYGANEIANKLYEELKGAADLNIMCVMDASSGQIFRDRIVQTIEESDLEEVDVIIVTKVSKYRQVKFKFPKGVNVVSFVDVLNEIGSVTVY